MSGSTALRASALLVVFAALGGALASPCVRPPSILLIVVDTLRADYLEPYGYRGHTSRHLARFARHATLFSNAYSQAPWTKPSIASLFTSLHPVRHRVRRHDGNFAGGEREDLWSDALPPEACTLAEALRTAGYDTGAFVANPWIGRRHGFAQGFDHFDDETVGNQVDAASLLERMSQWLEARAPERPVFLYAQFMDVHGPYAAPPRDVATVADDPGLGPHRALSGEEFRRIRPYLFAAVDHESPEAHELNTWRALYAGGIRAFDERLGAFFARHAHSGRLRDAVVVITSDHGEELADHGGWDHGYQLYEDQIRVPLLVRIPGQSAPRRVDTLVSLVDLMPTLLELAGAPPPDDVEGRSLVPLLRGSPRTGRARPVLASAVKWKPEVHAIRDDRYKLVVDRHSGQARLFDLIADPHENRDLVHERPDVARGLRARLEAELTLLAARGTLGPVRAEIGDDLREKLDALGYATDGTS